MKEVGVGLIGFGEIGTGVVAILRNNRDIISQRTGMDLVLKKIADIDLKRDRGVPVDRAILTRDGNAVIADPAVAIVIELVGGTTAAKDFVLKAIAARKPVVTANKALLAEHGAEIFAAAEKAGTDVYFEAAVAGGVPLIRALTRGLVANRIESIHGILNGTCNYILTRMTKEHLPFDVVLKDAQAAGYAEADPALDVDGFDTAHKAAILASLAYGCRVPLDGIRAEGIRNLAQADIEYARELGYVIKLLAAIRQIEGEIEVCVQPALVQADHTLASVGGVFNAILIKGDAVGETLYYGQGAGRMPTASAVVGDLVDAAHGVLSGCRMGSCAPRNLLRDGRVREQGDLKTRYYLRMSLLDRPGTMGTICAVLGDNGVSIASVRQQEEQAGEYVPVIIITHSVQERRMDAAVKKIDTLDIVNSKTVRIRIEDFV